MYRGYVITSIIVTVTTIYVAAFLVGRHESCSLCVRVPTPSSVVTEAFLVAVGVGVAYS